MSRTTLQNRQTIQTDEVELAIFWVWQEENVIFSIFWTFNFTNWRQREVWLALGIFLTNTPIVVGIPVKSRTTVELFWFTVIAHIIELTILLLRQKHDVIRIILSWTRVEVQETI